MGKKRALLSVSDKTGIVKLAKGLHDAGVELISTGGTEQRIRDAGIPVKNISQVTGFPECLDGRVKTLHPAVHGGILARRDSHEHMTQLTDLGIETIDFVVINLYPFKETVTKPDVTLEDAIENIDIGGPTMLRSAAKNHDHVWVLVDPSDYESVLNAYIKKEKTEQLKFKLALKVFEHTAHYDAMIATFLRQQLDSEDQTLLPEKMTFTYEKVNALRYGENPHQKSALYRDPLSKGYGLTGAEQLHGKELSFNNYNDAEAALALVKEFDEPAAVAVKHAVPCGVGVGRDLTEAYQRAYACDPQSIFGGIVALNQTVDAGVAEYLKEIFLEVIIAPHFEEDALEILCQKKNLRLLRMPEMFSLQSQNQLDLKKISGGLLVQESNQRLLEGELKTVTERIPTQKEMANLLFAWKVCKHVKSNGIVLAKEGQTLGLGQGQVSRVWAVEHAITQSFSSTKGAVLASDAFFPFADAIEIAAKAGVSAIIQPGGSVKDEEVIEMANRHGIAMVFTNIRHFKH